MLYMVFNKWIRLGFFGGRQPITETSTCLDFWMFWLENFTQSILSSSRILDVFDTLTWLQALAKPDSSIPK